MFSLPHIPDVRAILQVNKTANQSEISKSFQTFGSGGLNPGV
jgi:hypothetical protein